MFDYSILHDMIINAWRNINWIRTFTNIISYTYIKILSFIVIALLIAWLIQYMYIIIKNHRKLAKNEIKGCFSELRWKYKKILYNFRYVFIWAILLCCSRLFVSLIFRIIPLPPRSYIDYQWAPEEQPRFLWTLSIQVLLLFIIASYFIWFSFGNKFVRNIWILTYIIWITLIFLWHLANYWFYMPIN